DKAYLKAAIKLKAISYVEKPIDPHEIEESVREAIANHKSLLLSKHSINYNRYETMSKLALKMIYSSHDSILYESKAFEQFGISLRNKTSYTTQNIKLIEDNVTFLEPSINHLISNLDTAFKSNHTDYIFGIKQEEYIIVHLFFSERPVHNTLIKLAERFSSLIKDNYVHFISIGKTINSIDKIYESYNTAIILMHSSFFYANNAILYNEPESIISTSSIPSDIISDFSEALLQRNHTKVQQLLKYLKGSLIHNRTLLVNQVKDFYYKLFLELNAQANSFHISISADSTETILDYISKSSTYLELHSILEDKISNYFKSLENDNRDNSTVFLIKEYISQNYQNENLSIKDISEYVFLSSSYVCTIFKTETGKTLNQYLTEYRIERAKKLLMDSRYKITDISAKVGYNDGNYFGKTFKKLIGHSPTEFREQYFAGKL
ncbi:hypothetical protein CG709_19580, partial [Lachnotalea glycerini]